MRKSLGMALGALAGLVGAFSVPAGVQAADLLLPSTKAPVVAPASAFTGYPYGSSGLLFGIYTEAGGGSVNGSVPGVGSASLTSTQAGVGGTIGWAWGQKGSPVAFGVEGDFGWTNINGSAQGIGFSGPLHFEQRFVAFTPLGNITAYLPGFPNFGTLPPFSALPTGITASNLQFGIMLGVDEDDISASFPGLGSNQQWRVAPMVGLTQMEQLSNNAALRTYEKVVFPDKSVCVGPLQNACGGLGTKFVAGAGVYF